MIFANILKLKMAGNCFWVTIPRSVEGGRLPCPTAKSWLFYCISISEHFVISSTITYSSSRGLLSRTSLTLFLTTVLLNLKVGCFSLLCSFLICVHLEDVPVLHLLTQQGTLRLTYQNKVGMNPNWGIKYNTREYVLRILFALFTNDKCCWYTFVFDVNYWNECYILLNF